MPKEKKAFTAPAKQHVRPDKPFASPTFIPAKRLVGQAGGDKSGKKAHLPTGRQGERRGKRLHCQFGVESSELGARKGSPIEIIVKSNNSIPTE